MLNVRRRRRRRQQRALGILGKRGAASRAPLCLRARLAQLFHGRRLRHALPPLHGQGSRLRRGNIWVLKHLWILWLVPPLQGPPVSQHPWPKWGRMEMSILLMGLGILLFLTYLSRQSIHSPSSGIPPPSRGPSTVPSRHVPAAPAPGQDRAVSGCARAVPLRALALGRDQEPGSVSRKESVKG